MGLFNSRNEALKELIKKGMEDLEEYVKVLEITGKLAKLEEEGIITIRLDGATKQLLKERERFE